MSETKFPAYKIVQCSTACGSTLAWMGQRPSGAWEMIGCVCHQTPLTLVDKELVVTYP